MSGELSVTITDIDGVTKTFGADKTAELYFTKERYTPFTYFKGTFIEPITNKRVKEVCLYRDSDLLHCGTGDSVEYFSERGTPKLKITSYGYSKQLGQDFAEPGIIPTPTLDTIISGAGVYGVSCQQNTSTVPYVYYEEKTTVWDAACIYSMKAYQKYPFIRGADTVLCSLPPAEQQTFQRSASSLVRCGKGQRLGNIFSDVYTQDLNGNWTYHLGNSFAAAHNITRAKYYPPEREWVYDLNDQLKYYMYFSDRGREYISATFQGYLGEDLCDKETLALPNYTGTPEISKLTVRASPAGVFTDMQFYFDSFCNNT
jgi:hypothetical protein